VFHNRERRFIFMQLTKHWAAVLEDYVIDLAWSPEGKSLAAAATSGPVSIFELQAGVKQHELPGHEMGTNCLAWAPGYFTSALLATGGQDGCVKFWDAAAGQHTATTKMGSSWVEHIAWRPRPTAPEKSTGAESSSPSHPSDCFLAAAAGRQLSFIGADGTVRHAFAPAAKTLSAIAWEPRGGAIASAYFGGVNLWEAEGFSARKEYVYGNGIHALVWSPDSKWLVSGNQDPSVHLWIPATDTELQMSGYEGKVKELSFDHTSRWLATGGGKDACIWDCAGEGPEGREPAMLPHDAKICAVAFQNSHGLLATGSQDGTVMLWSPERQKPLRATLRMPHAATKLAWSPDDAYLAIGSEQGAVYVLKCEG
jgi:WD40 repeat protein